MLEIYSLNDHGDGFLPCVAGRSRLPARSSSHIMYIVYFGKYGIAVLIFVSICGYQICGHLDFLLLHVMLTSGETRLRSLASAIVNIFIACMKRIERYLSKKLRGYSLCL